MLLLKFIDLCILLIVFCEIFIRIYNKFSFLYRKYEYNFIYVNCFLEINLSFYKFVNLFFLRIMNNDW